MRQGRSSAAGALSTGPLCQAWRRRSLEVGWRVPGDWHTGAVDDVVAVACRGDDLRGPCELLGRARARAGVGIRETLGDLGALGDVLDWRDPPLRLITATAEGWVEAGLAVLVDGACEDPLTGLVTRPYLRTRLSELYREAEAEGIPPRYGHTLVVAELEQHADPWRRMARAIVFGDDLRTVFSGGETRSLLGMGKAAVLTPLGPRLEARMAEVRDSVSDIPGSRVWLEELPATVTEALNLVEKLAR
ncbi:MAG: hypothetical protein GEV11_01670 [Streptosporangiales bacterium]|nr:hypothetical protein [Streptosporangiales bacterium]